EIYDYLRLLFARIGIMHCVDCGTGISTQTVDEIVDAVMRLPEGHRVMLMAPMVRERRGAHQEVLQSIREAQLIRARVDGEIYLLEDVPPLAVRKNHTIEAIVDRLVIKPGIETRLQDSIETALRLSGQTVLVASQGKNVRDSSNNGFDEQLLSTAMACPDCGFSFPEIETRTFSFNSPLGACAHCDGTGRVEDEAGIEITCPECGGSRLGPQAHAVKIKGLNIVELCSQPLSDALEWYDSLLDGLDPVHKRIAEPIRLELIRRTKYLIRVGVAYLTMNRAAETLSGGELQRVRLATNIGSGLTGVCYVLDEPSIGLHPADHDRLIDCMRDLREGGNTLVVVEHDEATMRAADCLVDVGPAAGRLGGQIIAKGTPKEVSDDQSSLTGAYLRGERSVPVPADRRTSKKRMKLTEVRTHNLDAVTVEFPLGTLIGIAGVSGSGKSSLINETLYPALAEKLGVVAPAPGPHKRLTGHQSIDKLIPIDQSPIGRSSRSCPATYSGVLDEIRKVFAATRGAKVRGFAANRFSFNSPAGRCQLCKGHGNERIEMNFLSDLWIRCSRCGGKRFNRQTLQVRFKGASIADVLEMSIGEAAEFFENVPRVKRLLDSLVDVGLGYVHLGQPSTTLSGGEAQRIKLGTELARVATGKTLYLLDEPTTGLHFADIERLVAVLQRLVDSGNTAIVIEHNLELLAACDHLIEMGPNGGREGGKLVAEGTPEHLAECETATGRFLRGYLQSR
ncbi:MAG: excinuclease ABC subunit UvrA, partial [Planctomycetota bacterium]